MKKITLMLAGLGIAAAAVPATVSAAPAAAPAYAAQGAWQNINARQNRLYDRINMGTRNGSLTRAEATRLRAEFNSLVRLEAQYRRSRPGLTMNERRDLDRRFDRLSAKIRWERNDRQDRRRY